jgi:hypothetical protein
MLVRRRSPLGQPFRGRDMIDETRIERWLRSFDLARGTFGEPLSELQGNEWAPGLEAAIADLLRRVRASASSVDGIRRFRLAAAVQPLVERAAANQDWEPGGALPRLHERVLRELRDLTTGHQGLHLALRWSFGGMPQDAGPVTRAMAEACAAHLAAGSDPRDGYDCVAIKAERILGLASAPLGQDEAGPPTELERWDEQMHAQAKRVVSLVAHADRRKALDAMGDAVTEKARWLQSSSDRSLRDTGLDPEGSPHRVSS